MKSKWEPFVENVSEATVACLVTMVQGNVLALGLGHLVIALQTGLAAGSITAIAVLFAKTRRRWVVSLTLGVITAIADYLMHPGMFGSVFTEAAVTGAGAAALSWLVGTLVMAIRARRSGTE